jgi:hypothetical protein
MTTETEGGPMRRRDRQRWLMIIMLLTLTDWAVVSPAHQDPCHRLHSCPSAHGSYGCGDKGRCDQRPDNPYGLAGKSRMSSSSPPAPAPPAPWPSATTTPSAVTVCFTPGGNCTDAIVQALGNTKRTILVQAYSFPRRRLRRHCLTPTRARYRCK